MSVRDKVNYYKEDLEMFETPNEKFEYIFDLGKKHTTLPQEEKNEATFIEGCASPAWLVGECKEGKLIIRGEGSSEMAKGMLSLLLDIFSGQEVDDILAFDPKELEKLGIIEHLSPVRQQSLEAFLNKVYMYAKRCKEENA
ncbi:SufE family protein [Sulfurimonas sediminis]|uniref:SufE family protein n=1 Tax=Sulfurimonas sediminis TaxID=2590020 RepID=A0A7M1B6L7_9BACT|nr:SufE family protein [Sulfurimonas sediminis]QOP44408.1 SufE family protein [Sulfurimonas sediminis]